MRFAEYELDDVVFLEQLTDGRFPEGQEASRYQEIMDLLAIRAARPAKSVELLNEILQDF